MRTNPVFAYHCVCAVTFLLASCSSGSDGNSVQPENGANSAAIVTGSPADIEDSVSIPDGDNSVDTEGGRPDGVGNLVADDAEDSLVNPQSPSPGLMIDSNGSLVSDLPFIDDNLLNNDESVNDESGDNEPATEPATVLVPDTTVVAAEDDGPLVGLETILLLDGTPPGTPPIPSSAPEDCILAAAADGAIFCFSPATRTLRGWGSTSNPWWSFELPGENDSNTIRALQVIDQRLMLIAEISTPGEDRRLEVSVFSTAGQFDRSISFWTDNRNLELATHRLSTATIDGRLLIVFDEVDYTNNILPNENHGVVVMNLTIPDEGISFSTQFIRDTTQTNPPRVIDGQLVLELDHQPRVVAISTSVEDSNLVEDSIDGYQSIPFSRRNYLQKKSLLTGFVESPPLESLGDKVQSQYFELLTLTALAQGVASPQRPFDCPGGGTAGHTNLTGGISAIFTFTFDNCVSDSISASGVFESTTSTFCGRDCSGPSKTFTFTDFSASFANGEQWSVQGSLATRESRVNFSRVGGVIENPITFYSNSTNIDSLTMSNNGLLLQLDSIAYEYSGNARNGTGSWSGTGSLVLRDGVTETFDMDMTRTLEDAVQTMLSGYIEGRRSDGTSLHVEAGGDNSEQLLYTISAGTESIAIVNDW